MLLLADDVDNASEKVKTYLAGSIVDFELISVSESKIIDVFNF